MAVDHRRNALNSLPELEVRCCECRGVGHLENAGAAGDGEVVMFECGECKGVGFIVTPEGEELLTFIARHLERRITR